MHGMDFHSVSPPLSLIHRMKRRDATRSGVWRTHGEMTVGIKVRGYHLSAGYICFLIYRYLAFDTEQFNLQQDYLLGLLSPLFSDLI